MELVRFAGIVFLPESFSIRGIDAEDVALCGAGIGAGDKDFFTPEDGRRVPDAGEVDFPVEIFFGELQRNAGRRGDLALAVGSASRSR